MAKVKIIQRKKYKFTYLGVKDGKILAILHHKQRRGYNLKLQIVIGYQR